MVDYFGNNPVDLGLEKKSNDVADSGVKFIHPAVPGLIARRINFNRQRLTVHEMKKEGMEAPKSEKVQMPEDKPLAKSDVKITSPIDSKVGEMSKENRPQIIDLKTFEPQINIGTNDAQIPIKMAEPFFGDKQNKLPDNTPEFVKPEEDFPDPVPEKFWDELPEEPNSEKANRIDEELRNKMMDAPTNPFFGGEVSANEEQPEVLTQEIVDEKSEQSEQPVVKEQPVSETFDQSRNEENLVNFSDIPKDNIDNNVIEQDAVVKPSIEADNAERVDNASKKRGWWPFGGTQTRHGKLTGAEHTGHISQLELGQQTEQSGKKDQTEEIQKAA